jgi:hypothetical protein
MVRWWIGATLGRGLAAVEFQTLSNDSTCRPRRPWTSLRDAVASLRLDADNPDMLQAEHQATRR